MINLIKNEIIKLYFQKKILIAFILVFSLLAVALILQLTDSSKEDYPWKEQLKMEQEMYIERGDSYSDNKLKEIDLRLANNIPSDGIDTAPSNLLSEFSLSPFISILIPLFVILISSEMLLGEINSGNLKIILVSPINRKKILLSKILSIFIVISTLTVIYYLGIYIISAFDSGFTGWNDLTILTFKEPHLIAVWKAFIIGLLSTVITTTMYISLSIFLSNILKSSTTLNLILTGVFVYNLFSSAIIDKAPWLSYIFISNMNIYQLFTGQAASIKNGYSLIMLLSISVIFILLSMISSFKIFENKEFNL